MDDPWLFCDEHAHMEATCSWIARPCMDACVAFFLGVLETFRELGDILHICHMEVGWLLVRTLALEEHWALWRRALSPRWHRHTWITCMEDCTCLTLAWVEGVIM